MAFTAQSFVRGVRAMAGASLVGAIGFPAVILAIGTPIALLVGAFLNGLRWLTQSAGMTSPLVEGFVSVGSVVGGVLVFTLTTRRLLRFWRTYSGADRRHSSRHPSSLSRPRTVSGVQTSVANALGRA